jgi:hypothetical protein
VIQNIEDLPIGKRRAALDKWFEDGLPAWFDSHLLPVTKAIADRWGHLSIEAKKNGLSMTIADGLIAATAMEHDLVIVTRNDVPSSPLGLIVPKSATLPTMVCAAENADRRHSKREQDEGGWLRRPRNWGAEGKREIRIGHVAGI